MSDAYRLVFLLPQVLLLRVPEGRHQPCLAGCVLIVSRGLVSIEGPSREATFDQARRFFRVHARKLPALSIAATLETPAHRGPGGRDGYTIVVNSDVTIAPTSIEPDISSGPKLELVG